jgi:hypothetical protein
VEEVFCEGFLGKKKKRKKKWEKIEERGIMGVVGDKMGRLWRKLKAMINGAF